MKGVQFWFAWFRKRDMHCSLKFVLQLLLAFELVSSKVDLLLPRCLQQIGLWHWKATVILCSHLLTLCNLDCKPFVVPWARPRAHLLASGPEKNRRPMDQGLCFWQKTIPMMKGRNWSAGSSKSTGRKPDQRLHFCFGSSEKDRSITADCYQSTQSKVIWSLYCFHYCLKPI